MSIRILYIDDYPEGIAPIIDKLKEEFEVDLVKNLAEAQGMLLKQTYDVIILDWQILTTTGAKVLAQIRKENAMIKVVMVTAKLTRIDDLQQVVNLGLSKMYFKWEEDLLTNLPIGVREAVDSRDTIIQGLEEWLQARKGVRDKVIEVAGDKGYTVSELLEELKKNSEIGRMQTKALVSYMFDNILSKESKPKK